MIQNKDLENRLGQNKINESRSKFNDVIYSIRKYALAGTTALVLTAAVSGCDYGPETEPCYATNLKCYTVSDGLKHDGCRNNESCEITKPVGADDSECEANCERNDYEPGY